MVSEGMAFPKTRSAWLMLAASALGLEATALWFQHGMGLDPCVMCIYERIAVIGLLLAGLTGALNPGLPVVRLVGYVLWSVSAGWGLRLTLEHLHLQSDKTAAMSCGFLPEFPDWMPLHEWLPSMFLPTGYCDDIQWQWLSLTMVEWLLVVFALYLLVLAAVLISEIRDRR